MRKITRDACDAFIHGRDFARDNTTVLHNGITRMYLHGNCIAQYNPGEIPEQREIKITLAGWPTPTTRERLNGVLESLHLNLRIYQRNHAQFIGSTINDYERELNAFEWVTL